MSIEGFKAFLEALGMEGIRVEIWPIEIPRPTLRQFMERTEEDNDVRLERKRARRRFTALNGGADELVADQRPRRRSAPKTARLVNLLATVQRRGMRSNVLAKRLGVSQNAMYRLVSSNREQVERANPGRHPARYRLRGAS